MVIGVLVAVVVGYLAAAAARNGRESRRMDVIVYFISQRDIRATPSNTIFHSIICLGSPCLLAVIMHIYYAPSWYPDVSHSHASLYATMMINLKAKLHLARLAQ